MKIVLVHGRAQESFEEADLKKTWLETFHKGLNAAGLELKMADADYVFPYYGKHLERLVNEFNLPIEDVVKKGGPVPLADARFINDMLVEIAANSMVTPSDIDNESTSEITEKGPLNWSWVQSIVRAIDKKGKWGENTLKKFTYDVFLYLTIDGIRTEINKFIKDKIPNEPFVLVGHSLGTIICYNLLIDNPDWKVKKFITLGSPLGLTSVRKYLKSPLKMPSCITGEWFNAYDDRDVVALNPLDEHYFKIDPPIKNKSDVSNQTKNRHGIIGYLNDKVVANEIWLGATN